MGSRSHSRRRLGPFLIKMLESEKISGLEWHDRDNKLFKISWTDKRSTQWSSEDNIILKKWEMYNNRYKEGEPENWTAWKQTFRNALNKSPDVHAIPEKSQLKNTSMPFKVYKFDDAVNLEWANSSLPRKSTSLSSNLHSKGKGYSQQRDDAYPGRLNIPQVVIEELNTGDMSTNPICEMTSFSYTNMTTTTPQISMTEVYQLEAMDVSAYDLKINGLDRYNTGNARENVKISDPIVEHKFALDSDEFDQWFHQGSLMDMESLSSFSFNTPNGSLEMDKPLVKFQVFYSTTPVLEGAISNNGVRLFSDSLKQNVDFLGANLVGPKVYDQVEFPDVKNWNNLVSRDGHGLVGNIENVLEQMNRGLILYCKEKKLFALRLCNPRVFAWCKTGGSIIVDRKNKMPQQLFDMNIFKAQLDDYKSDPANHTCPSSKVIVTFAQEFKPENVLSKKLAMHLELTYVEAEELLQKEFSNKQDLQFSGLDSGDELLQNLYSLNLNGSE